MKLKQMIRASIPFFLALLSVSSLARADIVGGDEVQAKDPIARSTVALYEPSPDGKGGALCTASLIGPHTAVSAAHCVQPGGPNPVMIFGRDVRSPTAKARRVSEIAVHPDWRSREGSAMDQGDLAVVKIQGELPPGYRPIEMDSAKASLRKGQKVELAGFGISDARKKSGSGVLRKTQVTLRSPRKGKSEMILDQSRGHGACHGDSGGPAFVRRGGKRILTGVTNRSYPNSAPDDCAHQVVYTKIGRNRAWIDKTQAQMENSPNDPVRFMRVVRRPRQGRYSANEKVKTHRKRSIAHERRHERKRHRRTS